MQAKDKVVFFGTGEETRDWLHVNDVAAFVLQLATLNHPKLHVYNGSFGERITVREILYRLRDLLGKNDVAIEFNQHHKEGDPKYYLGCIEKAHKTGWRQTTSLEVGLSKYVDWFKTIV